MLRLGLLLGVVGSWLLLGCSDDLPRNETSPAGGAGGGGIDDPGLIHCATATTAGHGGVVGGSGGGGPLAPHHVIVAQGPTDPNALYALVTWDRNDPSATGYQVLRDGEELGVITVADDAWDDTCFRDTAVTAGAHSYSVRAIAGASAGEPSPSYQLRVRSDADFGQIYAVDSYDGVDDSDRIDAALAAATAAGGGVVLLAARPYLLSRGIVLSGDNLVLRGAGVDQTILQPTYPGVGGDDACAGTERIVELDELLTDLGPLLGAAITPGDRVVTVSSSADLAVGQIILLSETNPEQEPAEFAAQGIVQDPGTGQDGRYPYESNEIVAVSGTTVTFKYPFSYGFSTSTPWQRYDQGRHNGVEQLTIQGRDANELTWYDGLTLRGADNFAAEVKVRWTNRRLAEVSGHNLRLVGFQGPYGGPQGAVDGICRYKVQIYKSTNALMVGATMGRSTDDQNMSLLTIQQTVRIVVRNSVFQRSLTYGVNEHGEGSRHLLVENNYFVIGLADGITGILLGNSTWGFSGPMIIRNNTFESNYRDIRVDQNSYEVRILDNVSRNDGQWFVRAFGWAGPDTAADLYGSMRMTIARNRVSSAGWGLYLGTEDGVYPYAGMQDVVVKGNAFDVASDAIVLSGDSTLSKRFQVSDNSGTASYTKPDFVDGDYWSGNADGESYGSPTDVPWTVESFDWEQYDRD
jgi:hypothetical protein